MSRTARFATTAAAALAAALLAGPAHAAPASSARPAGTVFVQTDNPAGNAVVAYDRAADGTLRQAGSYRTGGAGGQLSGSVVDHLASQGSLQYDRDAGLLYVTNAGSDSITEFAVQGDRLVRLETLPSGGSFPVSITVHGHAVYVLNARGGGSIQGYFRVGAALVPVRAWHRALGLDPNQTPEFTSTPGQVAFTPDGNRLLVTTKNGANTVDVFAVDGLGGVAARPTVNSLPGTVPFAVNFDARGHLALAEAGTNALATFAFTPNGSLVPIATAPTGQAATCWVAALGPRFYASNAGGNSLSGFADSGSGALTPLGNTATDAGTVDAAGSSDGRYLYVQAGGAGMVDAFRANANGSLTKLGAVTVPDAVGAEGIAAS